LIALGTAAASGTVKSDGRRSAGGCCAVDGVFDRATIVRFSVVVSIVSGLQSVPAVGRQWGLWREIMLANMFGEFQWLIVAFLALAGLLLFVAIIAVVALFVFVILPRRGPALWQRPEAVPPALPFAEVVSPDEDVSTR
jgi:hypothetical protein